LEICVGDFGEYSGERLRIKRIQKIENPDESWDFFVDYIYINNCS